MTISSTTRIAGPFVGTGSASVFPFTFKVFAASDLDVIRLNSSTGVETTLVLTTDYTVTLNGNQNTNPGGSVTLVAGNLASGFTLTITSDIANLQPTDLTNQGGFYPEVITDSLDRATIQIQQMAEDVGRSVKAPLSDGSPNMELPNTTNRANKYLVFDANGLPSVSAGSGTDTALRTDLANATVALAGSSLVGFRANNAASTARTVLDKLRDVVSVKDFGAVGDGVTDDTVAVQACVDAASGEIVVFPHGAYRIDSTVNLPSAGITIDLGKSTILPYGTSRGLYRTAPTATATTTWASGFTRGTTVLGVGSATGMAVGQWLVVEPVRTGATATRVAAHASKIVDISGTNITIADPLPMDYTGLATTAYLDIKTYTALHGDCQITNGAIDNRNATSNPSFPDYGIGLVLHGYENVLMDNVEFIGPNTTTLESRTPCALNGPGLNATLGNCRFVDAVHAGNLLNVYGYNKANLINSYIDGSAFGVQFVSCAYAEAASNYVTGLQAEEVRQSASPSRSVRGIKSFGCAQLAIQDNYISGYESATKIEYTESFIVSGNYCVNCTFSTTGSAPSSSGGCINTGSQNSVNSQVSSLISNNVVVNCDGSAILVSDPISPLVIDGNTMRNIGRYAVSMTGGDNCVITNNSVWEALKDTSFTTQGVIDFSTTTNSVCDGNIVFNVTNTTVDAIRGHVSTHYGMGNKSTTNRLKATGGRVIHSVNSNVTGVEALPGTTNWVSPTVLCGVGAIEPLSMSAPSVPTTESLRFDLPAGCLFMVAANNRACLAFGDQNAAGITLIGTASAGVFTNTIGSAGTINISKGATSNQIRIQNLVASTQSIRVCAFGGTPTSISVAP